MADQQPSQTPAQQAKAEAAERKQTRLRDALKANMARRKTQARARNTTASEGTTTGTAQTAQHKET